MTAVNGTLSDAIEGRLMPGATGGAVRVGVLPGVGSGPEVVETAMTVLRAACEGTGREPAIEYAPPESAVGGADGALSEAVAEFCRDTFAAGGAVLAGAHGGRWVYELRRRFDLFCKLSPIRPAPELDAVAGPISPAALNGVDMLVVREQSGGVYQGRWSETETEDQGRLAEHSFSYGQRQVRRVMRIAAELARRRSGRLAVIVKDGGVPSVSRIWRACAEEVADEVPRLTVMDIDFAVYELLRAPQDLDVILAPNLFGDIVCDAGGALLGSRGITFGASFDAGRAAVYQTNHGAAHDLAGTDSANPAGQILATAMMLRESFGMGREAASVEAALRAAWADGFRTADVTEAGSRLVGTREMGERVAERIAATRAAGPGAVAAERP